MNNLQDKWDELRAHFQEIGIRGMSLVTPVIVFNNTLFIEYTGDPQYLDAFRQTYRQNIGLIEDQIKAAYGVQSIKNTSTLSAERLAWIKELIKEFQPSQIVFHLRE